MIGTLLFYLFVLCLVLALCKPKHGRISKQRVYWARLVLALCKPKHGRISKQRVYWALAVLLMVTVFRWDIGNDYANYAKRVAEIARSVSMHGSIIDAYYYEDGSLEISYIFLSWLFASFPGGYLWVIGTLGVISIVFIFLALKRVNGYYWGFFALFITEYIFLSWDAVRQGAAIAIILFSLDFIKQGNLWKYALCVVAAALFHTSAIIMLPFFLLRWAKLPDFVMIGAIAVMTVLMWSGVLTGMMEEVTTYFAFFEHYEGYADSLVTLAVAESVMYKLRLVLYAIFWSGLILLLPKEEMLYKLFITIGGCIFLFAMNSMSITRIAWYFLIAVLVALPIAMRSLKKRDIKKIAMSAVMAAMVFLFSYDVIRDSNTHGCSPYDSIFSTNYANQKFRPKSY